MFIGLYGCAEIYGTCAQVSIVDQQDNVTQNNTTAESAPVISNVAQSNTTAESAPVISLDDRIASTASNANRREESVTVSHSPCRHQFHHVHGLNVCLLKDGTVARRFQGFDQGLVFSHLPLQQGEAFEVKIAIPVLF